MERGKLTPGGVYIRHFADLDANTDAGGPGCRRDRMPSWKAKAAEEYAAEALACDECYWITFVPEYPVYQRKDKIKQDPVENAGSPRSVARVAETERFERWLQENLPSDTLREDGVGWIHVTAPDCSRNSDLPEMDLCGLHDAWIQLQKSSKPVNLKTITEIAVCYGVTSGKWLFYSSSGLKVNHLWSLVARGVVAGQCGVSAKVSSWSPQTDTSHVICVYNEKFQDHDDVLRLESAIRETGIKCMLMYKPDVYTYLGIYRNNQWSLKPTIYTSVYDIKREQSIIRHISDSPQDVTTWRHD